MKNLLFCFITLFIVISCKKEYVTITGKIDDQTINQVYLENNLTYHLDSVELVNGEFKYKTKATEGEPIDFNIILGKYREQFFVENKDISISAKRIDSYRVEVEINGGKIQEEYDAIMKKTGSFHEEYKDLEDAYLKALETKDNIKIKKLNELYSKAHSKAHELEDQFINNFITENPQSYVAAIIMMRRSWYDEFENVEKYLDNVDSSSLNTYALNVINSRLKRRYEILKLRPGVGSIAPDFTLNDVNNKPIKLSDEYKKVKYLLIEFWASWCVPCRKENPNLIKAYEKYNKKGFNILGVSWDIEKNEWIEAIEVDKLPWTQVISSKKNDVFRLYVLNSIPSNFLVDSKGKIVGIDLKGEELNKLLASLFEE